LCVLLATLVAGPAFASPNGTLEGIVKDETGGPMPGVLVTVVNTQTGLRQEAWTDERGWYTAPLLPPGTYDITATLEGLSPAERKGIPLSVGQRLTVDLELKMAYDAGTITVTASSAPMIETKNLSSGITVNQRAIESLPLLGRNFEDHLKLFSMAVARDTDYRINVAGQRGISNSIMMDGGDNNSAFFGEQRGGTRAPFTFSQEAVREFVIVNNGFAAEFGRYSGSIVNAVTKSGTNEFFGSAFWFYRDQDLVSRDAEGNEWQEFKQQQFGATFGGPIIRDKMFFFVSWDQQAKSNPLYVSIRTFGDETGSPLAPYLQNLNWEYNADRGMWTGRGAYTTTEDQYVLLGKLDYQINTNHRLTFRHNHTNFDAENGTVGGGTTDVSANGHEYNKSHSSMLMLTSIFSGSLYNEFRMQYSQEERPRIANSRSLPETYISGTATFGQNNYLPNGLDENLLQMSESLTFSTKAHEIKVGLDLNFLEIDDWFLRYAGGAYRFNSMLDFNNGEFSSYTQAFDLTGNDGHLKYDTGDHAIYVQDTWTATEQLTVNYGLRYDYQDHPDVDVWNRDLPATKEIPEDTDNIGPRIGVAYDLTGDGQTVIKAGAGIYYPRTPSILVANAMLSNGARVKTISVGPFNRNAPDYPNRWDSLPSDEAGLTPDVYVFDPDFENPESKRFSLSVEHQLFGDVALGVEYTYIKTDKLERRRDLNLAPPTSQDEEGRWMYDGSVIDDRFGKIIQFESTASSEYNGVTFKAEKRFSKRFQVMGSYTWSKSEDDDSNERSVNLYTGYPADQYDLGAEWGPSAWDVRHKAVLSGTVELPWGFGFSMIGTIASGEPWNALTGIDSNRDGYESDRPVGESRNRHRQPGYKTVDARLSKEFRFLGHHEAELLVEAFNLFNFANWRVPTYNQEISAGDYFGKANNAGTPRQIQLGLRYRF